MRRTRGGSVTEVRSAADAWKKRNRGARGAADAWQRCAWQHADVAVLDGAPVCATLRRCSSAFPLIGECRGNREVPSCSS